jgi:hypothetical protein
MARRFVSEFIWETDVIFNTNSLKIPLSVLIGITNTGATFPIAFIFISAESASIFRWVYEQLTSIIFYNYSLPKIVVGDFAKGFIAAFIEAKTETEQENDDILARTEAEGDAELIEVE